MDGIRLPGGAVPSQRSRLGTGRTAMKSLSLTALTSARSFPNQIRRQRRFDLTRGDTHFHLDTAGAENLDSSAAIARMRIDDADKDAAHASGHQRFGA